MSSHSRWLLPAAALALVLGSGPGSSAQVEIQNNLKFNSGQDVQPIFEGWSRNADGSFAMHFGYLNRNWAQTLQIPVGPTNNIEPGGPDRGQPTFFYTRTNRNLFTVNVSKDWGKRELVWTVTANGKTQKATAWLQPEWEIDPSGGASTGGQTNPELRDNKPPTLAVDSVSPLATPGPVTLNAAVTDDGIPKPRGERKAAVGQETPPILQGGTDAPVNVPQVAGPGRGGGGRGQQGPTVTWTLWRGPAAITLEPRTAPVKDGKAQTTASFTAPGEYLLRVRASDRVLFVEQDLKITVNGSRSSSQP
jgi:hypothetical protein